MLKRALGMISVALLWADAAFPGEARFGPRERAELVSSLAAREATLTAQIQAEPERVELYSRRGDARLFQGNPAAAVSDFEKMIQLDPSTDAPHWRLGIAYYFAGRFAESARQFAKYHAYDGHDRENGIWKFLAQARAEGIEPARAGMLRYEEFDREPFPSLYAMFAGQKTGADVFAEIEAKGLGNNRRVAFFASYYVGINEQLLGDLTHAREHLQRAVELGFTGPEPDYMWQVARLQLESLGAASP